MADGILYIDLGAHTGAKFREHALRTKIAHAVLFEPNPMITIPGEFSGVVNVDHLTVLRVAAWCADGLMPLYVGRDDAGTGSTLIYEKTTGRIDRERPIYVWACDFARWLTRDVAPAHPTMAIEIKMNIEGAEYRIFDRFAELRTLRNKAIKAIHLSMHSAKIGLTSDADADITEDLNAHGFYPSVSPFGSGFTTWSRR